MYYLLWFGEGHRALARRASAGAACVRTLAAASWAVATVLVVHAVIMPGAASTVTAVLLLPFSVASIAVMVVLGRPLMVVPSALVVVVIVPAMIVAGLWLATVSPVSVPSASADSVGSVVVIAALIVGSGALPLIVGVAGPLGGW